MTLTQLMYLVALAEHRHFGRAADACCVSQPTLSMQLQKLEDELGHPLIDRSFQPIRPTELGARVIEQARIVLAERNRIYTLLAETAGTVAGELRIAIIPTLASYLLPLVTTPFTERFPQIDLTVQEMTTEHILTHLAKDRLDAGLIATEEDHRGLVTRPLFEEPFIAYVHPQHRLAKRREVRPQDLSRADLWLLNEGHCFRDQALQLCGQTEQEASEHHIRFESGNLETLRHVVDRIGGVTLLPYLATFYLAEAAQRHVRPFTPPSPSRHVYAVSRRASMKHALIDAFTSVVVDVLTPLLPPATTSEPDASP